MVLAGSSSGSYLPQCGKLSVFGFSGRAEPARIQHDDLHAPPGRAVDAAVVEPFVRLGAGLPELVEQLGGLGLVGEAGAAVVEAVVVVVPHAQERNAGAHLGQLWVPRLQSVGLPQLPQVCGGAVAVNVVAHHQEQLRPLLQHGLPDRLRLGLVEAGPERDALQNGCHVEVSPGGCGGDALAVRHAGHLLR